MKRMMKEIESKRKNGEDEEENEQEAISDDPIADPGEVIHSKQDNPQTDYADIAIELVVKGKTYLVFSSQGKSCTVILARDKFTCCNSSSKSIVMGISVCAGCRKIAYCSSSARKLAGRCIRRSVPML